MKLTWARTACSHPALSGVSITRIVHRLVEEHAADVSYQMVRRYG
ncbi:hypothetical protein ACIP88_37375 [Streptomyces uncialis]